MSNLPSYHNAQRMQSKASIVIEGMPGSGKSGLALLLAKTLAGSWDKVAAIDTENRSLDLFEGLNLSDGELCEPFQKVDLQAEYGYTPSNYIALREEAIKNGALALVNDSISHAWVGAGGVLEQVSVLEANNAKLNKFNAWGQPDIMHEKSLLTEMFRCPDIHVISTVRVKEKFVMKTGEGIESQGEQQIYQADAKYEPDLLLRMVAPGTPDGVAPQAKVIKTRYAILRKNEVYAFTPELLKQIKEYLAEGADPAILIERQRKDLAVSLNDILKNDAPKQTAFRTLKKKVNVDAAIKLADMTLDQLQYLFTQLA